MKKKTKFWGKEIDSVRKPVIGTIQILQPIANLVSNENWDPGIVITQNKNDCHLIICLEIVW